MKIDGDWDSKLEANCANLFANLGWGVGKGERIDGVPYIPDITLLHHGDVYGYVDVVGEMMVDMLIKKKESIESFLTGVKPKLYILTNGKSFDVFYNGKYATTQTVPPSPDVVTFADRMTTYYSYFRKIYKGGTHNE